MAWKGLHLSRPARLSLESGQLAVARDDGDLRLPLEDIAYIVLDTPQAMLTSALLSRCMADGVPVITVDGRHLPNGVLLPFHGNHRQAAIAVGQLDWSAAFRKRCWQRIVVRKIENQARRLVPVDKDACKALLSMAGRVGSGDPDNIEARAARSYWSALFENFARRGPDDLRNKLLDYGYAVVRSGVARALVAHGLLPCLGLHHASATNPFNLADDLLEPLRPVVDGLAAARAAGRAPEDDLTLEDRQAMASVLLETCLLDGAKIALLHACEEMAASLVRASEGKSAALLRLPALALP